MTSLSSLPSGRSRPPMVSCFLMLSFFFKFAVFLACSSSSPVIFFLVFFLIYNPFFLLLFLFEVSPLSLLCPIQFHCLVLIVVNRDLSSATSFNISFDMCSVQLIFSILRHTFISKASSDVLLSHSPYFCTVQGHTSNQCFHHSFLEASSFYSILPLVILSSWKSLLSHCYPGASILGAEGREPQILGRGSQGGRWSRGRVVKYYILSCTGSMFESGYF